MIRVCTGLGHWTVPQRYEIYRLGNDPKMSMCEPNETFAGEQEPRYFGLPCWTNNESVELPDAL